jgi:hypothetical protein
METNIFKNKDDLIDKNLNKIANANNNQISLGQFEDLGSAYRDPQERFAQLMADEGLITIHGEICNFSLWRII